MKRKLTFKEKIKIFFMWMKEYGNESLIASCAYCKSIRIDRVNFNEESKEKETSLYQANYVCKDCGASAKVEEIWSKTEK